MTTTLEITVESTEGQHKYSSSNRHLITITKLPDRVVYQHDKGEQEQVHVFRVTVDPSFFSDAYSCLHLQLFNKRRIVGPKQLGWCLIPPSDIIGFHYDYHYHSLRFLSYRLRDSPLIINLSIRLICCSSFHTVTGIPLALKLNAHCSNNMDIQGGQSQSQLIGGTASQ